MNIKTTLTAVSLAGMAAMSAAQYTPILLQPLPSDIIPTASGITSSQGLGATVGRQGGNVLADGTFHAAIWRGTAASFVDLHPAGVVSSTVQEVDRYSEVGNSELLGGVRNAQLWSGTSGSAVNLHPAGYDWSQGWGVGGGTQAGFGLIAGGDIHALLWSGTASSVVDLHPAGYQFSYAYATSGTQQVGEGAVYSRSSPLLWYGTAASVVDLTPAGYLGGGANSTDGVTQGGYVITDLPTFREAAIWKSSAASFTSLHPAGYVSSSIWDVEGDYQAGYGLRSDGQIHAFVWKGRAASAVNLNNFLPAGFTDAFAFGVDAKGNVTGHGRDAGGNWRAIYWVKNYSVETIGPKGLNGGTFKSAFQIRFRLKDGAGNYVDDEVITTKLELVGPPDTLIDPDVYSNQGDTFTFNPVTHVYRFGFKVVHLEPGTYRLTLTFSSGEIRVYTFTVE